MGQLNVSVSVGREPAFEKFDDQNQNASVPELVTEIVALPPSSAARPLVLSDVVNGVLAVPAPDSVPSTGPVTEADWST